MINESVIQGLNTSQNEGYKFAYLVDNKNQSLFSFLFNPEEKSFSRQSKFDEGVTALTSVPSQYYRYTTGLTLQLPNLLLESYNRGKNCKLLLQRLQALMVANPKEDKYAPTQLVFQWGSDSFGPCVITDLNWTETSWLNGEVATARVNITLLEIPGSPTTPPQDKLQAALNKQNTVTDRQKVDASKKAKEWLTNNIKKLPETTASLVRFNKYKLTTSNKGIVTITDSKGKAIGTVGTLVGNKFDITNNNLIKK